MTTTTTIQMIMIIMALLGQAGASAFIVFAAPSSSPPPSSVVVPTTPCRSSRTTSRTWSSTTGAAAASSPQQPRPPACLFAAPSSSSSSSSSPFKDSESVGGDRSSTSSSSSSNSSSSNSVVPIVLLSGFLGTGKTSALRHLLHDRHHQFRLGVIVNDMAAVNVDAKLLSSSTSSSTTTSLPSVVQMQNGCACCSLADELYVSVQQLLMSSPSSQSASQSPSPTLLDAIVVELSGVADPAAIRNNWAVAPIEVRQQADIHSVVTLVDATTFGSDYLSWEQVQDRANDWGDEVELSDEATAHRKVSELLAEQVEAANLLVLNKVDLATTEQVDVAQAVARALNPTATIQVAQYGVVDPRVLLGLDLSKDQPQSTDVEKEATSDAHAHDEGTPKECADLHCSDPTHAHSHEHHHHHHDPRDPTESSACTDPGCTDDTHSHSHDHHHEGQTQTTTSPTSLDSLGITSFVYRASRPFEGRRLMKLLGDWPVPMKTVLDKQVLTHVEGQQYELGDPTTSPFVGLLRSKGFCWLAPSRWNPTGRSDRNSDAWRHDTAMYWSHAGKHFSISSAGRWWGTLDKEQMKQYFENNMDEYEKIVREDFVTDEFGDRRQEVVFIGTRLDPDRITAALDACLLNEAQMNIYRQKLQNYRQQILSYDPVSTSSNSGLFGVGSSNHLDVDQ